VTTSDLLDGVHAITANATDLAGNVGLVSAALPVTIDTKVPVAPSTPDLVAASDHGVSNTDSVTKINTPMFTGTAEANATITLLDRSAVVGTGHANALGAWSMTTSTLVDGVHAISADATDLAGNVSVASAALPVTIDTTPSAVPSITAVTTAVIAGAAEANSTINLFNGAVQIATASTDATGVWSIPLALSAGTHPLIAKSTDLAGNTTPSATLTAIIGTSGNDTLSDGGAPATMAGGTGNDTYLVNNASDVVVEGVNEGIDTVKTTLLTYTSGANVENLTFIGSATSSFTGTGNALDNTIIGGAGNNTLIGGAGNDTLTGGGGNNVFGYPAANFGADIITNFRAVHGSSNDLIDISGLGVTAATFATSVTIGGGPNALISVGGGAITLNGVNQSTINITDFQAGLMKPA
jgi:large repetitive protein